MLIIVVLNIVMLNVDAECHYAECFYAECYAECHYAECCYVKCRYAECYYADCPSGLLTFRIKRILLYLFIFLFECRFEKEYTVFRVPNDTVKIQG